MRISKQFGLNPSVRVCSCCGKEMDLLLFGTDFKDERGNTAQAPMKVMTGEICDDCRKVIDSGGVFFIEVRDGESGNNPYRTGRLLAIKREACEKVFTEFNSVNYMEKSLFEKVFGNVEFNAAE